MSFRRPKEIRRRLMLFPLMDVFFILLIFFLAIAAIKFEKPGRIDEIKSVYASTPVPQMGKTHVLIQVNTDGSFIWLDSGSRNLIQQQGSAAFRSMTYPLNLLQQKAREFCDHASRCSARQINIAVRCPDDLPYGEVWDIQKSLREVIEGDSTSAQSSSFSVKVSLLPGSRDEIMRPGISQESIVIHFAQQR